MASSHAALLLLLSIRERMAETIERATKQARQKWTTPVDVITTDFINFSNCPIYPFQPVSSYAYRYSSDAETSEYRIRHGRHCIAQEMIMPDGGVGKVATSGYSPALMLMSQDNYLWFKRAWYYYAFLVADREWRYTKYENPQSGAFGWTAIAGVDSVDIPFVYPAMLDQSSSGWPAEYTGLGVEGNPNQSTYFPVISAPFEQFDMEFEVPRFLNHRFSVDADDLIETMTIKTRVGVGMVML